jgi:uncharacterized protein (DUF2164 family)
VNISKNLVKSPGQKKVICMKKDSSIKITKERRAEMLTLVKNYFAKERGEDMGDLAAGLFLDFIIEKIGPEIYNQAVDDSYHYMKDSAEDLLSIRK